MVMVVATVEVDGTVVAMMVAALVAVAMPVPMAMVAVMVPVMVVMSGPVLVPLRGRRTGEQHEGGSDQTCNTELHGRTLLVRDGHTAGTALNRF
jgi:membrane protein implicated in regulation of membrane protease activity